VIMVSRIGAISVILALWRMVSEGARLRMPD